MFRSFKLLFPAIVPSWNFFDVIAPSPRIQFSLLNLKDEIVSDWSEFRPRLEYVSFKQMLLRICWNPIWNESLFMVSCAERIMENPTEHSELEILDRIKRDLLNNPTINSDLQLQFRLEVIERQNNKLIQTICFHSRIVPLKLSEGST